jgi:hypothetical protein
MSNKKMQDAIIASKKAQQKHYEELQKERAKEDESRKLMLSKNPNYYEELYADKPGQKYYLDDEDKAEQEFMEAEQQALKKLKEIRSEKKEPNTFKKIIKKIEIESDNEDDNKDDKIIDTNVNIPDIETLIIEETPIEKPIEEKPIKQYTKSIFDFDVNMQTQTEKRVTEKTTEKQENPVAKIISVKKAPYDLKPSNEKLQIEELNKQLCDMQEKYNKLMIKYNSRGTENKELKKINDDNKKYKAFYDKAHNKKNSVKDWIEEAYTISNDYEYYIKCCNLFEEYNNSEFCDKSISQIAFNKQIELLGVLKSKKTGYNCFYGLQKK